ncbi:MAG: tetratricopeptide repeat protein [Bdellovibrionales bacterium]
MNKWLSLSLVLLASQSIAATTLDSYWRNREGLKEYDKKSYYSAYRAFLRALEVDPLNPEIQMNLGRTFEANEEFEKAEQAYRGALTVMPKDSPLRFEALFNLAGVYAKEKKIDEALAAYQEALALEPDSIEVKTNIELLFMGGGGGGGESQDQQQPQQQDQKQNPGDGEQQQKPPPKKPNFQSQELTDQDVKRILDEIKNQEQNIRAQDYEKGLKEMPKGKDW